MRVAGDFSVITYGLHYRNTWAHVPDWTIQVDLITLKIGDAANGMCGGMAFTARDLFETQTPAGPETVAPSAGPQFNYVAGRLLDSFNLPYGPGRYLALMSPSLSDHDTLLQLTHGRAWQMVRGEWPKVKADIDNDHPSPLGLVCARSFSPLDLGKNHQVLAYAYEQNGDGFTIWIYDPNHPNDTDVRLTFDNLTDPSHTVGMQHSRGTVQPIAFFRSDYTQKQPTPWMGATADRT